jgi:hypothetical protein
MTNSADAKFVLKLLRSRQESKKRKKLQRRQEEAKSKNKSLKRL